MKAKTDEEKKKHIIQTFDEIVRNVEKENVSSYP